MKIVDGNSYQIFRPSSILHGCIIEIEGDLQKVFGTIPGYGRPDLPYLACIQGNPTAMNAVQREGYTVSDEPFYYGKIGALGYIVSGKDLREEQPEEVSP